MKAVVIFAFLCPFAHAEPADVECTFKTNMNWAVLGNVYTCYVQNNLNIVTKESPIIESASPMPGEIVKAFHAESKIVHYFPRNLDKIFPSLELIAINMCSLKEIRKEDLKPFQSLRNVDFWRNDIEVLEQDLFVYNPNLQVVCLSENKISRIDPNVFDHLQKLSHLYLLSNKCVSKNVVESIVDVKSFIKEVKTKCADPQFPEMTDSIRTLDDPNIESGNFLEKISQFKSKLDFSTLQNSMLSMFKKKLDNIFESWTKTTTSSSIDPTPSINNNNGDNKMAKYSKIASLEADTKAELEGSIKEIQNELRTSLAEQRNELKTMQTIMNTRISALEAMTEKIFEIVRKFKNS